MGQDHMVRDNLGAERRQLDNRTPIGASGPTPQLRPLEPGDTGFLYYLASRYPESWPRICLKGLPRPHDFEALVWSGVLAQYLVQVDIDDRPVPIGLIAVFDHDHISGTAWIESIYLPGDHHHHVMVASLRMLIDRTFSTWPFRKLYGMHHSFEAPMFSDLPELSPYEEVRLRDVFRHDGLLWDRVISTIDREAWTFAMGDTTC